MKIERLILENFAAINNAMNANKIEIDFSKALNKICLLIGPNGSGKTTILSLLNPFADLGNLDVRNGNNLILKNKDGYKEIHIRKDNDYYVIKHFYTAHKEKSHSVKSYIEKNGEELNVNGNVTSFKEYVKEELHIEPSYLKLIRLGANVTSLIDMTSTERKNYMSKIMDDIGVYLDCYKSVNSKLRQLDEMISHTVDKINKLGVVDKTEIENDIERIQKEIDNNEHLYMQENSNIAVCNSIINDIDDYQTLHDRMREAVKKYKRMESILEKKKGVDSLDVNSYTTAIMEYEKTIAVSENEININTMVISENLKRLNEAQEELRKYAIELQKELEKNDEMERMDDNLKDIRKKLNTLEDNLDGFSPKITKDEYERFMIFLKNTQQILGRTYEFGKGPVSKVVELMNDKKNVVNYVNSHLLDIDDEAEQSGSLFLNKIASQLLFNGTQKINIPCENECKAKDLFIQLQNLVENSTITDKKETASFYHDMNYVYQNLITVLPRFSEYGDIISALPEDLQQFFILENMYKKITDLKLVYDEKKFNEYLTMITEYDTYLKTKDRYEELKRNLQLFSNLSSTESLQERLETTKDSISKYKSDIESLKERNSLLKETIQETNFSLETAIETKEAIEKFDEIKELSEKLTKDYEKLVETKEKMDTSRVEAFRLKTIIDSLKSEITKKENDLYLYKSLNKDLKKFNEHFDNMTFIKESTSSKKGIPLHIISGYLNNTEAITNELLDIAYDGKIYIDNFNISPTEFGIPFYNNGVRLDDVKFASQGELSFLSMALSFALSTQTLQKYNIMLLDEIDGPLDTRNREKFIDILENQIDRIHSEQNFLITHNSMFSSYPVDILDLSGKNDKDQYPLANFINIDFIS